jgi:hypothetical protein
VPLNAASAGRLGGVAGGIGAGDDLVHLAAPGPDRRKPDAGADRMRAAVPAEVEVADGIDDRARRDRRAGKRARLQDDGEFVAAEPRDDIFRSQHVTDGIGHALQQRIARGMATGIVDRLEVIEIDEHELVLAAAEPTLIDQVLHGADEARAVGKPGQRVMGGGVGQLALQGARIGEVLEDDDQATEFAAIVHDRRHHLTDAAARVVAADKNGAGVLVAVTAVAGQWSRQTDPLAGFLIDRPVDMAEHLAQRFAGNNAGKLFSDRVHESDAVGGIGTDDRIADRLQRHPEPLLFVG